MRPVKKGRGGEAAMVSDSGLDVQVADAVLH